MLKNKKFMFLGVIGIFAMVFATLPSFVRADFSPLSGRSLTVGSSNGDVTALQQFLSSGKDVYPSGLVTGYFGGLTKAAVIQLQLAYDIDPIGIAGPATNAKINSVISNGQGMDISAPIIYNLTTSVSGRNMYINFNSNEAVKTTVFYDTTLINWNEPTTSLGSPIISGATLVDNTFSSSKQLTLSNLNANSNYYFTVMTTDSRGNISLTVPKMFQVGQ